MSENIIQKLNLKALQQPVEEKITHTTESSPILIRNQEEIQKSSSGMSEELIQNPTELPTKEVITKAPKISLGMIKKNIDASAVREDENETKSITTSENIGVENTVPQAGVIEQEGSVKVNTEGKTNIEEKPDMGDKAPSDSLLDFIKNEAQEDKVSEEKKAEISGEKKDEKIEFQNYESGFKKQSINVIKRIQNFKYTPKTRVGFLIGLISLTVISISFLMIFFPEHHSFTIYKTSVLDMIGKKDIPVPTPIIPAPENPVSEIDENSGSTLPEIDENSGSIMTDNNENSGSIIPEIINGIGEATPEDLKTASEQNEVKKEKLRQHLLKKYSS